MFSLLKRELRTHFLNPVTFALITVLSIVPVVVFTVYMKIMQSQSSYAGFENMISVVALFFAVIIPLVTVFSFFRDKKLGVEDFLYSMPVSKRTVMLSKILSQIIVFAVPTAVLSIFPLIFARYGNINFGQAYLALLMLFAFEIFIISFSSMIALKLKKIWSALVVAYSVLALSFILGILSALVRFLPFGTRVDKVVSAVLNELSIFKKLDTITDELFDWTALLFFLVGAIFFIFVSMAKFKKNRLIACASLLLVFALGTSVVLLPYHIKQLDINKNKLYTPGDSAKEYLSKIDEEITVYLINPYSNENALYNAMIRTVEAGKNIKLEIVNTVEDDEFLEKYGLDEESQEALSYSMIIESSKRWRFISGEDYFYYYNTDKKQYLSAQEFQTIYTYYASILSQYGQYYDNLSDSGKNAIKICEESLLSLQNNTYVCLCFEDAFLNAVSYVTAENIPAVYFLSGHGEEGTLVNPYDFKSEGKLPENADLIVINSPSEDYSESEVNTLIDYLEDGGKLYILTDTDNMSMPNLTNLLSYYGLTVDSTVITESDSDIITVSVNKSHDAFASMNANEVTVKGVSKIITDDKKGYVYSNMLSYKYTEGEGEDAKAKEYPVALSVSDENGKKITLFTGAVTFNAMDNGIGEEELDRVSACITNVMQWMFDDFDSGISKSTPKLYQKTLYMANDSEIVKIFTVFVVIIIASVVVTVAYIVSRKMRSKRVLAEK